MKRLFIVASLAIMAVGCQKTEVQNEVLTPIGFNAETGKATRAIMSNSYENNHSFGVIAYLNDANETEAANKIKLFIPNKEITNEGTAEKPNWKNKDVTYYWPNDPDNNIDFYAYSPYSLIEKVSMTNKGTLVLTNYEHVKYYGDDAVDFMVATPVLNAVYTADKKGVVPVQFHHEMTQVVFKVKTTYTGGTITLKSIKLKDIVNKATYSSNTIGQLASWTKSDTGSYNLTIPTPIVSETGVETTPVTMIPQELTDQNFTITYEIDINGVVEKVSKDFTFSEATSAIEAWNPNAKVTYTLTVGLNTISFMPSVTDWAPADGGSYNF